jgi:small subunit ribosomal protein S1
MRVEDFGVFVEMAPGVEGLVHVSELSWSRIEKPHDRYRVGDSLAVKVIGLQTVAEGRQHRISLSVKQLSGDPWEQVAQRFQIGDTVRGTVTRCAPFGAFVEISSGIEGLVHISEMSYRERIIKPEDRVSPGDDVEVTVKDIDPKKRRISLSIRDAEGDPWIAAVEKYRPGQAISGVVEKKEKFGIFVQLEPGVTGLLPKGRIRQAADAAAIEKLKPGEPITVIVQEVLPRERKMTLSAGDAAENADWRSYAPAKPAQSGVMAEKLQAALKAKKPT